MSVSLPEDLWVDLIGKPFELLGRGPEKFDCYGLVITIFARRGIIIPDFAYNPSDISMQSAILGGIDRWVKCGVEAGAGLLFHRNGIGQHMGVAIDDVRFIHASEDFDQVLVSNLFGKGYPYGKILLGSYQYAV